MTNLVLDSGYQVTPEIITSLKTSKGVRQWLSQPRQMADPTTEAIMIRFRSPVYINYVRFDLLQISQNYQLVYYDANGNEQLVLDKGLAPVKGSLAFGSFTQYYTIEWEIYPILASAISLRMKRQVQPSVNVQTAVSLGVQNFLCERRIDNRQDAQGVYPTTTDSLGNIVERVVKDWDPIQALDGNSGTFWKSGPQPDPNAVVWFAADVRDANGQAQKIDRFYIDPVYAGQTMTAYYSSDDTIGTRLLSNSLVNFTNSNAPWQQGVGWSYTSSSESTTYPMTQVGLNPSQSWWLGIGYTPQYSSSNLPTTDLLIIGSSNGYFQVVQRTTGGIAVIVNGIVVAETTKLSFNLVQSIRLAVRFVLSDAIGQAPKGVYIDAFTASGNKMLSYAPTIDTNITMPTQFAGLKFGYSNSTVQNIMIKQQTGRNADVALWAANPVTYITPNPVVPDTQGNLPSTTLDNVVFGQDFTQVQLPQGGLDKNFFAEKLWIPISKTYKVTKGMIYLPQPVNAKYFKVEFTKLTSSPYTIWRDGVQVTYQTYPVWVKQIFASLPTTNDSSANHIKSQISFNGLSLNNVGAPVANPNLYTVEVTPQPLTPNVTHTANNPVVNQFGQEKGNATVYRMTGASATTQAMVTMQKINGTTNGLVSDNTSSAPTRDSNWWVLPGQQQRLPAATMQNITSGQTVTSTNPSDPLSVFFPITCVHRYDVKTVTRDKGIAYFAGLNEFAVYRENFSAASDTLEYVIHSYDSTDFSFTNAIPNPVTGATTVTSIPASITNTNIWNSTSTFQRIQFTSSDRGLHTLVDGVSNISVVQAGSDPNTATWDDPKADWNDTVVTWGATAPVVSVSLQSNYYFNGYSSAQISRQAVSGDSEITTLPFSLPANTRLQLGAQVFPTINSGNTYSLRLIDLGSGNDILYESQIFPLLNQWNEVVTLFYSDTVAHPNVAIEFVVSGSSADIVYIGDLFGNATTIVYQASNDGGNTYYELTNIINQPEGFFQFPSAGNQLKIKATMYDTADYLYGYTLTPLYQQ